MENEQIEGFLFSHTSDHKENHADKYIDHYLEQYRIYLHIFNSTNDRRQKSNEFFLGLNTAIIGMIGYLETKSELHHDSVVFFIAPLVGIGICFCWYRIIRSYMQLHRAKFKVIHNLEHKLPAALYETEWEILGKGKDPTRYRRLSSIEKNIPVIFTVLYLLVFIANLPWEELLIYLKHI